MWEGRRQLQPTRAATTEAAELHRRISLGHKEAMGLELR